MRFNVRCSIVLISILILILVNLQIFHKRRKKPSWITIFHENRTYRLTSNSFSYDVRFPFLNFAFYNVEQRQRVLKIDSRHDLPVSSQWKSIGHFYPTQIAQFGLSHWSRLVSNFDKEKDFVQQFDRLETNFVSRRGKTSELDEFCSEWKTTSREISLRKSFLHFRISSTGKLQVRWMKNNLTLIYSTISTENENQQIFIDLKNDPTRHVNRNLFVDLMKTGQFHFRFQADFLQFRFCARTSAFLDQLTIGNEEKYQQNAVQSAVDWLLENQHQSTGCWFINITRKFGEHRQFRLPIPWCSAMAQGQAISLLVRYYLEKREIQYLNVIRRALKPMCSTNLTRAYFDGVYVWLEEYPLQSTETGLFVLNGCLYALISLFDAQIIERREEITLTIEQLGTSLVRMLPLYVDPNQRNWSLYDLSHLTIGAKINRASFSYHLVHIILLETLSDLFRKTNQSTSTFLGNFAKRFRSSIVQDEASRNDHLYLQDNNK